MVEHRRQDLSRRVERAEHAHAGHRMAAHLNELGLVQRAGLQEDRGRNRELPDVVEERAEPEHREPLFVETDRLRHCLREDGDARCVTPRVGVTGFDRGRELRKAPHRPRLFKIEGPFPASRDPPGMRGGRPQGDRGGRAASRARPRHRGQAGRVRHRRRRRARRRSGCILHRRRVQGGRRGSRRPLGRRDRREGAQAERRRGRAAP